MLMERIRKGTAALQGDTAAAGARPRLHTWQEDVKGEAGDGEIDGETSRQKK